MLVGLLILLGDLADIVLHALFGRHSGSENKQRGGSIKQGSKKGAAK